MAQDFPTISASETLFNSLPKILSRDSSVRSCFSGSQSPESPVQGQLWYDTDNDRLRIYDGSLWVAVWDSAGTLYQGASNILARISAGATQLTPSLADSRQNIVKSPYFSGVNPDAKAFDIYPHMQNLLGTLDMNTVASLILAERGDYAGTAAQAFSAVAQKNGIYKVTITNPAVVASNKLNEVPEGIDFGTPESAVLNAVMIVFGDTTSAFNFLIWKDNGDELGAAIRFIVAGQATSWVNLQGGSDDLPQATTGLAGIIRAATDTEARTGTANNLAVTPQNLQSVLLDRNVVVVSAEINFNSGFIPPTRLEKNDFIGRMQFFDSFVPGLGSNTVRTTYSVFLSLFGQMIPISSELDCQFHISSSGLVLITYLPAYKIFDIDVKISRNVSALESVRGNISLDNFPTIPNFFNVSKENRTVNLLDFLESMIQDSNIMPNYTGSVNSRRSGIIRNILYYYGKQIIIAFRS